MNRQEEIIKDIKDISHKLSWKDIEYYCSINNFEIKPSKKGYKVYIKNSVWSVHLEHKTSDKLKHGIIRELRKILIKEEVI